MDGDIQMPLMPYRLHMVQLCHAPSTALKIAVGFHPYTAPKYCCTDDNIGLAFYLGMILGLILFVSQTCYRAWWTTYCCHKYLENCMRIARITGDVAKLFQPYRYCYMA